MVMITLYLSDMKSNNKRNIELYYNKYIHDN